MTFYRSFHTLDYGEGRFHWFVLYIGIVKKTNLIRVWCIVMDLELRLCSPFEEKYLVRLSHGMFLSYLMDFTHLLDSHLRRGNISTLHETILQENFSHSRLKRVCILLDPKFVELMLIPNV